MCFDNELFCVNYLSLFAFYIYFFIYIPSAVRVNQFRYNIALCVVSVAVVFVCCRLLL